jgi:PPOX class probable F420-dependent enzyme
MQDHKVAVFEGHQFLNLETFRKSGEAVQTPVWFVEDDGMLYVRTIDNSGKVKRIRNNPRVRVAPCDVRGGLLGEWGEAQAHLVDEPTAQRVDQLLEDKYGEQKRSFDEMSRSQNIKRATIAIELR